MLSKSEIYLLNEALDGEDIYGLPKDNVMFLKEDGEESMKALKEKKIINEDNSINEISYKIINNLDKYKKANSYIWINDIVASIDDSDFMYLFRDDEEEKDEYIFQETANSILMYSILKQFKYLCDYKEVSDNKVIHISVDEFQEKYLSDKKADEVLVIKKEEGRIVKSTSFYAVYFLHKNSFYKYDMKKNDLYEINPKEARIEIGKLININAKEQEN